MKCFNHPTLDAVGLCKVCSRGVCRDCIVPDRTPCCCISVECQSHDALLEGRQLQRTVYLDFRRAGMFCLLAASALLFLSPRDTSNGAIDYWALMVAVVLLGFGIFHLVLAGRMKQK